MANLFLVKREPTVPNMTGKGVLLIMYSLALRCFFGKLRGR